MQCLLKSRERRVLSAVAVVVNALLLSACGASATSTNPFYNPSPTTSSTATVATESFATQVDVPQATSDALSQLATPQFHAAPVILDEPSDVDSEQPETSAALPPHAQSVPVELSNLSTRRLTLDTLRYVSRYGVSSSDETAEDSNATPMAAGSVVATYTPAQIRAAYGLPALPVSTSSITSAQAAQLGAGQTIYIVDAQSDPNIAAELAAFNQKFGLPGCTTTAIATNTALPLAAASSGCTLSVVYNTASGTMTSAAPAYDSGWATEIALDVEWSHATAPLARIILIEAPDASLNSLLGGVALANAMGSGVVSMSFAAGEGSWTSLYDSNFSAANMSYLAAAGDAGAGVNWPAVSPHVLAIGGTSLTYTGSGNRSETVWSGTGGGVSQYTATPSYQTGAVPGMGTPAHRSVTDVSFNADPSTGQYVAVISSGSSAAEWMSVGGTSLSTPQWAGVLAIANALRAQSSIAAVGAPHSLLYTQISTVASTYAGDFADITQGSDGTCSSCYAKTGYDLPTGLGTPNVSALLTSLSSKSTTSAAPVVGSASVSGTVGTALSFSVTVTAAHPVSYVLSNAPTGMSISTAGLVSWTNPAVGNYSVTVTATDTQTGLSGHGTYSVTISSPQPPVVASETINGTAGTALTFTLSASDANPVTWSLTGAPSGMSVSSAGVVSWASPAAGSWQVTATANDTKTGLSGHATYSVVIAAPAPPSVAGGTIAGRVGAALSFSAAASGPDALTYMLSGAPSGMSINSSGVVGWSTPVAGKYSVTVIATDAKTGLSGRGVYTVTIAAAGPTITASSLVGTAGKKLTGSISFADSTSNSLSISVTGVPSGMAFTPAANSPVLNVTWNSPTTGSYTLVVSARDGNGLTSTLNVPVSIASH